MSFSRFIYSVLAALSLINAHFFMSKLADSVKNSLLYGMNWRVSSIYISDGYVIAFQFSAILLLLYLYKVYLLLTIKDWIKTLVFLILFQIAIHSYLHFSTEAREQFWHVYLTIELDTFALLAFSVIMLALVFLVRRFCRKFTSSRS